MEENEKKAFDFAADQTKQLITLATAIITLTITFSKELKGGLQGHYTLLATIWGTYILSIFLGIMTLMALTGNLDPTARSKQKRPVTTDSEAEQPKPVFSIYVLNIRLLSFLQILTFILALIMTCFYGYSGARATSTTTTAKDTIVIRQILQPNVNAVVTDTVQQLTR